MKINELISNFQVFISNEERALLSSLKEARPLNSFSERDQYTIESLIRKSLVIKIGQENPKVISNEI